MKIRLILCDFDCTVTENDTLDILAKIMNKDAESRRINFDYQNGKIDGTTAIKNRFELIKGLALSKIESAVIPEIELKKGAKEFFLYAKQMQIRSAIISGNMEFLLASFQKVLEFDEYYCSKVSVDNGRVGTFISMEPKSTVAKKIIETGNYFEDEILAIGDSQTDMDFMKYAKHRFVFGNATSTVDAIEVESFDEIKRYMDKL